MATLHYNIAAADADVGGINWVAGDYRMLLLDSLTTTPDDKDNQFVADIAADEPGDASYARVALTGKTSTADAGNDRQELSMDTVDFGALDNTTPVRAVIFLQVTNDADSRLHSIHDLAAIPADGTGYQIVVGTEGAVHIRSAT